MGDVCFRPKVMGGTWCTTSHGLRFERAEPIAWSDIHGASAEADRVILVVRDGLPDLVIEQRWTGGLPPSAFVRMLYELLPSRIRDDAVDAGLRCVWGWAVASELGRAEACAACGGPLTVSREAYLAGRHGDVEAVLTDVERRTCASCHTHYPLDEEHLAGDLLFEMAERWHLERDLPWSDGVTTSLRRRGFLGRARGELAVRTVNGSSVRPALGDIQLAVLNALCGSALTN